MIKKIGLFGGSFNPIHNAHVQKIRDVLDSGLVDEVWVLPCRDHSFDKGLLSGDLRAEMIELALAEMDGVKVCREELDFEGKSYTYDTLVRLKEKFDDDFYWIGGSDLLYEFSRWYKFEELLKLIGFVVFLREGFPIIDVSGMNVLGVIDVNVSGLSSSEVREKIKSGESLRSLVPLKVGNYIISKDLYKDDYENIGCSF